MRTASSGQPANHQDNQLTITNAVDVKNDEPKYYFVADKQSWRHHGSVGSDGEGEGEPKYEVGVVQRPRQQVGRVHLVMETDLAMNNTNYLRRQTARRLSFLLFGFINSEALSRSLYSAAAVRWYHFGQLYPLARQGRSPLAQSVIRIHF